MAEVEGAAAKPKKPFYKKWWVWVIGIIVLAAIAGGGSGGGKSSATDAAASPSTPAANTQAPASGTEAPAASTEAPPSDTGAKIGQPLKVGDLVFTVTSVSNTKKLKSPLGNKKGNWLVVAVKIANKGKEAVTIDSSFFKLIEADGTEYETDSDNLMYLDADSNFFLKKINPKLSVSGKALFAIPASAKNFKLQVQTGVFGTETGEISLTK